MNTHDKFAGYPPVHPIARHGGFKQTCKELATEIPEKTGILALLNSVATLWRTWQKRRTDRQALQHMISLDDKILHDIGLTRSDVIWASRLPPSRKAAAELKMLALQNKNH